MKKSQNGFTLIELVMVIVILGVLSAVAIPKFVNLKSDAAQAAVEGVAGALSSASAINYASRSLSTSNGVVVDNCDDVDDALQGGLSTDFTIGTLAVTAGASASCTVTGSSSDGSKTATFTALGIL